MATTIHIPADLLARVDARAARLKLSRSRFIADALQRVLAEEDSWPDELMDALDDRPTAAEAETVDDMVRQIAAHRRSKAPPAL